MMEMIERYMIVMFEGTGTITDRIDGSDVVKFNFKSYEDEKANYIAHKCMMALTEYYEKRDNE